MFSFIRFGHTATVVVVCHRYMSILWRGDVLSSPRHVCYVSIPLGYVSACAFFFLFQPTSRIFVRLFVTLFYRVYD